MISAPALDFLSGLAAGAGINLLTSTSGAASGSKRQTVIDAVLWMATAALVSYCARLVARAELIAARHIDSLLTGDEVQTIRHDELAQILPRFVFFMSLGSLALIAAVLLIPGLIT